MNSVLNWLSTLALIVLAACAVFFIKNCCIPGSGTQVAGGRQVIAGALSTGPNTTVYSSTPTAALPNYPATGLGERGIQMRMPAGTASKLRVTLTPSGPLSAGQMNATVRVNGVSTLVTCQLSAAGDCDSGAASVTLADDDRLDVMVSNNFAGPFIVVQWTLLYN